MKKTENSKDWRGVKGKYYDYGYSQARHGLYFMKQENLIKNGQT